MRRFLTRLYRNIVPEILHNMLLRLGGNDPKVARDLLFHHQIRQAGFGLSVLLAGVLATLAGWHTAYNIAHNRLASICFGILWGLLVTALDYQILIYINKYNKRWIAALRVTTSFVLSLLTSTPIILLCSQGPIQQYLSEQKIAEIKSLNDGLHTFQQSELTGPIKVQETYVHKLMADYLSESDGTGGTKHRNIGPITIIKKQAYQVEKDKLDAMQLQAKERITAKEAQTQVAIKELDEHFAKDELAQLKALFALLKEPAILVRWILLMSAIILLEMSPLILKLSNMESSPYTEKVDELHSINKTKDEIETANAIRLLRLESQLKEESDTYTYNKKSKEQWVADKTSDAEIIGQAILDIKKWATDKRKILSKAPKGNKIATEAINTIEKEKIKSLLEGKPTTTSSPGHGLGQVNQYGMTASLGAPNNHMIIAADLNPDHPFRTNNEMLNQALLVCGVGRSERERVHLLYNYIVKNFPFDDYHEYFTGGYRTAEDVWHDRKGVCGELSAFFIAMCRCVGLDVRYVAIDRDADNIEVEHAAASVHYSDGSDLQLIDIAEARENASYRNWDILSDTEVSRRFSEWRRSVDA